MRVRTQKTVRTVRSVFCSVTLYANERTVEQFLKINTDFQFSRFVLKIGPNRGLKFGARRKLL